MSVFESWRYNWYGFWRGDESEPDIFPFLEELIDREWHPPDHSKLVAYLEKGLVFITCLPSARCELCSDEVGDPGSFQTDGEWLWPVRLAHFVKKHSVRLPNRMVEHIQSHDYVPRVDLDVDPPSLPWPRLD